MDLAQARAFFDQFDSDTRQMLVEAGSNDIVEWTERLVEAWQIQDADGQRRACHSLKGLCENFGAHTLLTYCDRDLSDPASIEMLRDHRDLTLRLLREVARGQGDPG